MRKILSIFLLFISSNVFAEGYLMAGIGNTAISIDTPKVTGITSSTDYSYELIAGYRFHRFVAVETNYTNFGNTKYSTGGILGNAVSASAVLSAPLCTACGGNDWTLFAKGGVARTVMTLNPNAGSTLLVPASQSKSSPVFGGGIEVRDEKQVLGILRLSYTVYAAGEEVMPSTLTTIMLSAGGSF